MIGRQPLAVFRFSFFLTQIQSKEIFTLKRSEAYIGVLIDDLVNKGTLEPYRMFTSRAEYRILLRQDNADLRLTEKGHSLGLASNERLHALNEKKSALNTILKEFTSTKVGPEEINDSLARINSSPIREKNSIFTLLKRPEIGINEVRELHPSLSSLISKFSTEVAEQAEIIVKYEPYIDREQKMDNKIESLDLYRIQSDFDYDRVKALSSEAREKLKKQRPATIGQMSRISGVSPSDVSIMTVYLGK